MKRMASQFEMALKFFASFADKRYTFLNEWPFGEIMVPQIKQWFFALGIRPLAVFSAVVALVVVSSGCKLGDNSIRGQYVDASSPAIGGGAATTISIVFPEALNKDQDYSSAFIPSANGVVDSFSISPTLPAGLMFSGVTGAISGAPTEYRASTSYTITAHTAGGDISTVMSFMVQQHLEVTSDLSADQSDSAVGDGVCDNGSGVCTLRAAIEEASYDYGQPQAVIDVPAGTYLMSSLMTISRSVQIKGAGALATVIDGQSTTALFKTIHGQAKVKIEDVSIVNGAQSGGEGGAALHMQSAASVELRNCIIDGNTATNPFNGGGAVRSERPLLVENCKFENNTVTGSGNDGGVIYQLGSSLVVRNSEFTSNVAQAGEGGAINLRDATGTVENSSFSLNSAASRGGAIYIWGNSNNHLTVSNSTFYNNATVAFDGKAIAADFYFSSMYLSVYFSTIFDDTGLNYSLIEHDGGEFNLFGSIIYDGAAADNCLFVNSPTKTSSYNLSNDSTCGADTTDIVGVPTMAGPYQLNGGTTRNFVLDTGSAGLDVIPEAACLIHATVDQRGLSRPAGASATMCDIGATEVQ